MLNICLHAKYANLKNATYMPTICLHAKSMPTCYICLHAKYDICLFAN